MAGVQAPAGECVNEPIYNQHLRAFRPLPRRRDGPHVPGGPALAQRHGLPDVPSATDRITPRKGGYYRCNACQLDFTVRTGTIFERSHVPLHKWVYAMYLLVTARKGISRLQLAKEIGVTQKTAWFVLGRLREACGGEIEKLQGTIEIDETFVGGKERNRTNRRLCR